MCSTFFEAEGTVGTMTAGMARAGIGVDIACVTVLDGVVSAVGIVGNGVNGGAIGVSTERNAGNIGVTKIRTSDAE